MEVVNMIKILIILSLLFIIGCGEGEDDTASESAETTQCGDFTVDLSTATEVVESAEEARIAINGSLLGRLPEDSVIIVACGGSIVANEETNSTTETNTESNTEVSDSSELSRLIDSGDISSIQLQ